MTNPDGRTGRTRRWLWPIAAVLYLVVAMVGFSVWRLPVQDVLGFLAESIERQTGQRVEFGHARLGWTGRLFLRRALVDLVTGEEPISLLLQEVELHPEWLGLLRGVPALRLQCKMFEGTVELRAQAADRRFSRLLALSGEMKAVELWHVSALAILTGGRVQGQVAMKFELDLDGKEPSHWAGEGQGEITGLFLENVVLGPLAVERLPLGNAAVQMRLEPGEGVVEIVRCETTGSEVELTATGRVTLASRFDRSRLDLQVRIRLSGQTHANFAEFFELMGYPANEEGWIQLAIRGTMRSPRVSYSP